MNNCSFVGRVGRDAELRFLQDGTPVCNFSLAITSGYGKKEKTTWVDVSKWGKGGEAVSQYIHKGNQIGVNGEIELVEFEKKDGTKVTKLALRAEKITLIKNGDGGNKAQEPEKSKDFHDDDIPF